MKFRQNVAGLALAIGLTVCLGCGDDSSSPMDAEAADTTTADAGVRDALTQDGEPLEDTGVLGPHVRIGTGQDEFQLLAVGQRVDFYVGPQSSGDPIEGFHIWGALRAELVNPMGVTVGFEVLSRDRTEMLGASARRRVNLLPDGQDGSVAFGFPAVLDDCCAVRQREIVFRASLTDANGTVFTDEVDIVGGPSCLGSNGREVCP